MNAIALANNVLALIQVGVEIAKSGGGPEIRNALGCCVNIYIVTAMVINTKTASKRIFTFLEIIFKKLII